MPNLAPHRRQPSGLNQQLPLLKPLQPLSLIKRPLHLVFSLKRCLAIVPLLLLPYATTTQALSVTTAEVINGNQPYITFDNGNTKITTTDSLLGITLSDGTTETTYTPANNPSTLANPILLPKENQTFADISMLVPTTADSITLNDLIGPPNNYWGDDDGDGQGVNGITATGSLSLKIEDNMGNAVGRNEVLKVCNAPYKLTLTSTNSKLSTQYGVPNSATFADTRVYYYINPKTAATVCFAKPLLDGAPGPKNMWNQNNGFLVQSTDEASYGKNFPTTGANNLYFDLVIGGMDSSAMEWPSVTRGGITATMEHAPDLGTYTTAIRVTLTGPAATPGDMTSTTPSSVNLPSLPQKMEIVGYDSSHTPVLKYGFELKQWFVNRGIQKQANRADTKAWCAAIGYRIPNVLDLTNAACTGRVGDFPAECRGAVGATPPSDGNNYTRHIGAGFFSEWGNVGNYHGADFTNVFAYWTGDLQTSPYYFYVEPALGKINNAPGSRSYYNLCANP
ncbi:hypothetical protein A9G13_00660 [Gilliamella sp. wkB178]|uniref:hypothetical protein n=1 Tax=Gilliamella sp. wkB178 TaxID=3120259 RepID=UPI00080E750B|nr:hypothetical protein [Gilliamella apicola]OCG10284.1 hypothetical protein A9G13_00660 [Gilliamella apicola]